MRRYRVTIDLPGQPNISVIIEAHSFDEAQRIARAQYPQGRIISTLPA